MCVCAFYILTDKLFHLFVSLLFMACIIFVFLETLIIQMSLCACVFYVCVYIYMCVGVGGLYLRVYV